MALFGLIGGKKALGATPIPASRTGWFRLLEANAGNWQRNIEIDYDGVRSFHAVYACMTLIASDIAKLRVRLVQLQDGVWQETTNPAFSPVLRKPNGFQTRVQFWENYILSKLSTGNVYVLKKRDNRGIVTGLYLLDPSKVMPLVAPDGEVFYDLSADNLAGIQVQVTVPAREIIHDRMNTVHHPLVGTSPIYAAGLASMQALGIQNNSTTFFNNGARPGGILSAPGNIGDDTAQRLKEHWDANYTGANAGKVAVLGDGLTYQPMMMTATDAQVVEQLKWTAEVVCSTFHVPPYKIGVGQMPSYNNVQALNVEYYGQCLQILLEAAEACLDEGLGLDGVKIGVDFDQDNLLRMDTLTQMDVLAKSKDILELNERRAKLNMAPKSYGNTIYMQQQDHSAEAIAARDAQLIAGEPAPVVDMVAQERAARAELLLAFQKGLN